MLSVMRVLKSVEHVNKKIATLLLSNIVRAHPCKVDPTAVSRVLFLRYDRLGDMIVSTPLFRIVKEQHPHWEIGVLGTRRNVGVIEEDPNFIQGYYLSQFAAGQATESNCVDGGSDLAPGPVSVCVA